MNTFNNYRLIRRNLKGFLAPNTLACFEVKNWNFDFLPRCLQGGRENPTTSSRVILSL
jgi:hypothetical protein